ncbi:vanadium-dependent haloperoxidase [Pseudoxanthomonas helianthi]|uniref:Vanadium-dependent haloperoxidase n=1 Tax=Pseudoxanthomonas helianthi TaxID=1453541 RepID=A0A941AVA2_9GAMM|nr:vanadium-dependent haloperoxidase [Pseudoxanthomonas helianthi]MBP3983868.1 vanadium-dependent haloperoxidase [Pseudoxanthomonas helianthi]
MRAPLAIALLATGLSVRADAITDCNIEAGKIIMAADMKPPPANRVLAIVHTATYEAVNAITHRYPDDGLMLGATPDASIDAAVAAASHAALSKLLPAQQAAIDASYQATLAKIADNPAKSAGLGIGERAAQAVLTARENDGIAGAEAYRPQTAAGVYVPTALPAVSQWPGRKPWLMASAAQFRPDPPPTLAGETWARDYNEIKAMGAKNSTARSAEQTAVARFWEATLPPIYYGVVRSVADMPGRDVTRNARLYATVAQAVDDALIAVFDAKYHYGFWRPITAIRNGDNDGNNATERDASWVPFIDTPMHPEYPCAHCIVASTVGTVLKAELGGTPAPRLTTTSYTAGDVARSWTSIDAFVDEVSNARIWDGVHFRNSTEVGKAMGRQVGELAAQRYLQAKP